MGPGRYMVKYKTAGGEEQEYKLLVENDPLLSIGVDGEKVGLDRIEERIFGKGSNIEGVVILIGKEEKRYLEGEDLVGELLEEKVEGDKVYSIFVKRGGKEESKG